MPRTTPHSQPPPTPIQVRHRTTATEKAPVRGYPDKLFIYRLNASPYWWVRYWEKGKTFRKSTKTRCRQAATAFAKQFFSDTHQLPRHRAPHKNAQALSGARMSIAPPARDVQFESYPMTFKPKSPLSDRGQHLNRRWSLRTR